MRARGERLYYEVDVKNNDSYGCGRSSFLITADCPSRWECNLETERRRIVPGESFKTNMIVEIPREAYAGEYEISVMVVNESSEDKAIDTVTYTIEEFYDDDFERFDEKELTCMLDILVAQLHSRDKICDLRTMEMDCRGWGIRTYRAKNGCEISLLKDRGWVEATEEDEDKEKNITINSPARNEVWKEGERYSIRWDSENVDKLGIYLTNYSCCTETPKLIAIGVDASSGRHNYRVPTDFFSSKDGYCHFRDDYEGWQSGDRFKLFVAELNDYKDGSYTTFGHQVESDYFRIVSGDDDQSELEKRIHTELLPRMRREFIMEILRDLIRPMTQKKK